MCNDTAIELEDVSALRDLLSNNGNHCGVHDERVFRNLEKSFGALVIMLQLSKLV